MFAYFIMGVLVIEHQAKFRFGYILAIRLIIEITCRFTRCVRQILKCSTNLLPVVILTINFSENN
jgi:hypothetical protein